VIAHLAKGQSLNTSRFCLTGRASGYTRLGHFCETTTTGDMERRQQGPTDRWPADPSCLVLLTILEIDHGDTDSRELLLADLLCAAWPSSTAQDQ
jgi:hypothetical protein